SEINLLCREVVMIEGGRIIFSDSMSAFNNYLQSNTLRVCFKNPPDLSELRNITHVSDAENIGAGEFRIHFQSSESVAEYIVEASTENGWRLTEIHFEKQMLDDVFKQLSTQAER